ncbi:MAG: ferredoxin [Cyclobacteriaceae bacterium]|nr:ferredoxin [Cyclobacteriaceae bacterium]
MSKKTTEDRIILEFFREDSTDMIESHEEVGRENSLEEKLKKEKGRIPGIASGQVAEASAMKDYWKKLRRFFTTSEKSFSDKLAKIIPLQYHIFQQLEVDELQQRRLVGFPFVVSEDDHISCKPLFDILKEEVEQQLSNEQHRRFVVSHLPETIRALSARAEDKKKPAGDLIGEVLAGLPEKYGLKGKEAKTLADDLEKVIAEIPEKSMLVWSPEDSVPTILQAAIHAHALRNKKPRLAEIEKLMARLREILLVEAEKNIGPDAADKLKSTFGNADTFMDFEKLSQLIPESSSEKMAPERINNIKETLQILQQSGEAHDKEAVVLLDEGLKGYSNWAQNLTNSRVVKVKSKELLTTAVALFNTSMAEYEQYVAAAKMAELIVSGKFDDQQPLELLKKFNWKFFSPQELNAAPEIIVVCEVETLVDKGLSQLFKLFTDGLPIKILALQSSLQTKSGDFIKYDLGAMAVSFRNTYTVQSTGLDPGKLFQHFSGGLASATPGLFYVLDDVGAVEDNSYLIRKSTAVESRVFPEFTYAGNFVSEWGSRFNIADNPLKGQDWPIYSIQCKDADKHETAINAPFTPVDFLAMDVEWQDELMVVPPGYWTDDLVTVAAYLQLPEDERFARVPYIWVIDKENEIGKAAISWKLVLVALERLDFWHYLQDSAGVQNYHADRALQKQKERFDQELDNKISQLKVEYEQKIADARNEGSEVTIERLTSFLLDMDTDILVPSREKSAKPAAIDDNKPADTGEATQVEKVVEEEADLNFDEPWIETPMCTSCNECININKRMFQYNADKLAFLADAKAGTFAQLVQAAEVCPANIIHPGKPLNPSEPGLDELIKVAEKYNA